MRPRWATAPAPAGLTRRQLLAYGSAALAAGLVPRGSWGAGSGGAQRIAVVGAGLSGLSAAFELSAAGHEVTVFEARARAGGRVRTVREPFADGLYAEAGAATVMSHHDLTRHYAKLFELPLVPVAAAPGAAVGVMRGRRIVGSLTDSAELPVELTAEERSLGVAGMTERYWGREIAAAFEAGASDTPGWPFEELRPLDDLTLAELWRRNGASEGAVAVLRFGYLDMVGEGVDSYSALFLLREAAYRRRSTAQDRIDGGNDRLPLAFAERLRARIHYGTELVAVTHRPDQVRLGLRDRSGTHVVTADRLVLAIPFSVLRDVAVAPAFSPGKERAIRGQRHTSVTRSWLQCRTRFWEAAGLSGNAMTDLDALRLYPVTGGPPGPRGLLESFAVGEGARRLAALELGERLARLAEQAGMALPGMAEALEGGNSIAWDEEPFARGAYPWYAPGELTAFLPHVATPEGRVHFAGDQTSPWPGWMQGALHSGRRVAAEIGSA